MAGAPDIFAKVRLTPGQLRAVAEKRFADAMCLLESGKAERANGAIYMGGFAIECLLKALMLERRPNLQSPVDPAKLSKRDLAVFSLLYRHELDAMIAYVPELEKKLAGIRTPSGRSVWQEFQAICEQWTVFARYSPKNAKLDRAARYLETIKEVKKWLKEL